jgi:hypothetical protein
MVLCLVWQVVNSCWKRRVVIELDLRVAILVVVIGRSCDVFFGMIDKIEGRMYALARFLQKKR